MSTKLGEGEELGPEERVLRTMLAKLGELRGKPVQLQGAREFEQALGAVDQALLDAIGESDSSFENVLYANHGGHLLFKKPLTEVRLNLQRYRAEFDAIDFSVLVSAGKYDRSLWCTTRLGTLNDVAYEAGLKRLSGRLLKSHPRRTQSAHEPGGTGKSTFQRDPSHTDTSPSGALEIREIDFQSLLAADAGARDEYGMPLDQVMTALAQRGERLDRIDFSVLAIAGDFVEGSLLEKRQELYDSKPFKSALKRLKHKPDLMESFLEHPERDARWEGNLVEAYEFAASAHKGQERLGTKNPYIVHPAGVAAILQTIGIRDLTMIRAALLHDVAEDTAVSLQDIKKRFGQETSGLVRELTRPAKTRRDREAFTRYLHRLSGPALMIKLADRIDNVRDLVFIRSEREKVWAYLHETRSLFMPLAEKVHPELKRLLSEACAETADSQSFAYRKEVEKAVRGTDGMPPLDPEKISEETIQFADYGSLTCFSKPLKDWIVELEATTGEIFGRWRFTGLVLAGRRERYQPIHAAPKGAQQTSDSTEKEAEPDPAVLHTFSQEEVLALADVGSKAAFGLSLESLRSKLDLVRMPLEDEEIIELAHLGINLGDSMTSPVH